MSDAFALADALAERARRVLLIDGYHLPMLWLIRPGGKLTYAVIPNSSRADRFLLWRAIADDVQRTGATSLVTIGEVWLGSRFAIENDLSPTDDPFHGEALMITAVAKERGARSTIIPFFRRHGRIYTQKPRLTDLAGPSFLEPVLEVWRAMPDG
jgi:hypothetical protein